jgi:hypothetical protein
MSLKLSRATSCKELSIFDSFQIVPIVTYTLDIIYYSRFKPLAFKNFITNLNSNSL